MNYQLPGNLSFSLAFSVLMTAIRNAEAVKDEIRSGTGSVIERNSNLVAEGRETPRLTRGHSNEKR